MRSEQALSLSFTHARTHAHTHLLCPRQSGLCLRLHRRQSPLQRRGLIPPSPPLLLYCLPHLGRQQPESTVPEMSTIVSSKQMQEAADRGYQLTTRRRSERVFPAGAGLQRRRQRRDPRVLFTHLRQPEAATSERCWQLALPWGIGSRQNVCYRDDCPEVYARKSGQQTYSDKLAQTLEMVSHIFEVAAAN